MSNSGAAGVSAGPGDKSAPGPRLVDGAKILESLNENISSGSEESMGDANKNVGMPHLLRNIDQEREKANNSSANLVDDAV